MRILLYFSLPILLSLATSCIKDPFSESAEDVAERIRANTPTKLPPITSEGANTIGAYVEVDTGRVLFVASGVNRSGAVGTESSSCDGMYAVLDISEGSVFIEANWCPRPEIDDRRILQMGIRLLANDSVDIAVYNSGILTDKSSDIQGSYVSYRNSFKVIKTNRTPANNSIAGEFSGTLINRVQPFDTIVVNDGRFDVTYGTTP